MTHRSDVARGREIIERWCLLAEQRLDYLTELFETGRWRRFHSEVAFLENIQEAKTNVETWRMLLTQEGAPDNSAVNTSWLIPRNAVPPRKPTILRDELRPALPRSLQIVAAKTAPEPKVKPLSEERPAAPAELASTAAENAWQQGLDLSVMQQRYPLLRNNAL
jgi:uncharacterized repeat protein (TIGR03809 family)